jgi:hypothetical protein
MTRSRFIEIIGGYLPGQAIARTPPLPTTGTPGLKNPAKFFYKIGE